jgi:DNA-binding MarR family transcriptional regulator
MSMVDTDAGKKEASADISIESFAELVAMMSRFLTGFSNVQPFKEADIGLAEWIGLNVVKGKSGVSAKELAKRLGITSQRTAQIADSLRRAGLVSVGSSGDNAKNLTVTKAGEARLSELNGKLLPLIATRMAGKERTVARAGKTVRGLMNIVTGPKKKKAK